MASGYTGWRYGGCPIWKIGGTYYKLLSKHKSRESAMKTDGKSDECDKIAKIGKWHGRFNRLPRDVVARLASRNK